MYGSRCAREGLGQQPGVDVAGILKRLEAWAADSPERSRMLVMAVCLGLTVLVLLFIFGLAWVMLDANDLKELTE